MTNREIYDLMIKLGLILPEDDTGEFELEELVKNGKDVIYVMNLVTDIMTNNDSATIEKFLLALLLKSAEKDQ